MTLHNRIGDHLRALVTEWGAMLDERTESYNLIIPASIEERIDALVNETKELTAIASKRAKAAVEANRERGVYIGRGKIPTPSLSELKEMLKKRTYKDVAEKLGISRSTLRNRLLKSESIEEILEIEL